MAIVVWDGSLDTGFSTIDAQHKHLFEVINSLHDKIKKGEDKVFLLTTLDSLKQYVRFHFRTEEELMVRHEYPDQDRHMRGHRDFEQKIKAIEERRQENIHMQLTEILGFLLGWIVTHIQEEDLLFAAHLKDAGA